AHELDATTGKTRRVFELPKGGDEDAEWGFIAVEGDILLGGARAQGNQVPVFTDREVAELKGEALLDAAKRVRSWLGFDPRERKADDKEKETDAASKLFVLDNLNKLLVEPGFLDRIPERVRNSVKDKGKLAELEKKLVEYHLVPGRRADDFDAVVLKRHLLHLYYGLPDFTAQAPGRFGSVVRSGSRKLVAFDRTTGEVLWERSARFEMRPNAIVAGGGKAFFLDRLPEREAALRLRRGEAPAEGERLVAIDLRTGEDLWSSEERIFGTWLGYSAKHDVLLQAGARSRDRSHDEVGRGMIAYRGTSGDVVWSNDLPYDGPCVLLEDRLITQGHSAPGFALDVRTGEKVTTPHPVTGAPVEWRYTRN
ncbi:MAG TPA: PQQ-binding-like beta-propeller repeat protein, partial [Planctomycetota bacterium]|nr:PQQ-binding-like beta-propeller repeat protein [Planctomycetota bacterium]